MTTCASGQKVASPPIQFASFFAAAAAAVRPRNRKDALAIDRAIQFCGAQ